MNMRARKDDIFPSAARGVTVAAVVLGAAACGINSPASGGTSGPESAQSPRPGTAVTVRLSRAPSPGRLTPAPPARSDYATVKVGHTGPVIVTTSDDGATVVVAPGQLITVVLSGQGVLRWNRPRLAQTALGVLRQVSASGGYPSQAPARASFHAVREGTEAIISSTDARCLHAHPRCAIVQRLWRVTVVVRR